MVDWLIVIGEFIHTSYLPSGLSTTVIFVVRIRACPFWPPGALYTRGVIERGNNVVDEGVVVIGAELESESGSLSVSL